MIFGRSHEPTALHTIQAIAPPGSGYQVEHLHGAVWLTHTCSRLGREITDEKPCAYSHQEADCGSAVNWALNPKRTSAGSAFVMPDF